MWHVLSRLLPGRWVRVPLLAAFAWAPLTLATDALVERGDGPVAARALLAARACCSCCACATGAGPAWLNGGGDRVYVGRGSAVARAGGADRADGVRRRQWCSPMTQSAGAGSSAALRRHWVLWSASRRCSWRTSSPRPPHRRGGRQRLRPRGPRDQLVATSARTSCPVLLGGPWTAHLDGGAVHPPDVGHGAQPGALRGPRSCCSSGAADLHAGGPWPCSSRYVARRPGPGARRPGRLRRGSSAWTPATPRTSIHVAVAAWPWSCAAAARRSDSAGWRGAGRAADRRDRRRRPRLPRGLRFRHRHCSFRTSRTPTTGRT